MKIILPIIFALFLAGCYTTVEYPPSYVNSPNEYVVKYSPQSPPVIVQERVCYWITVPEYAERVVVHKPNGETVVAGTLAGAAIGSQVFNSEQALGAVLGGLVGAKIASGDRASVERVVIGSTKKRVCNGDNQRN